MHLHIQAALQDSLAYSSNLAKKNAECSVILAEQKLKPDKAAATNRAQPN